MGIQIRDSKWRARIIATAVAAAILTVLPVLASATTLGGVSSANLSAWSSLDSVPSPVAFDHFDGCTGNLNNDRDLYDQPWHAPSTDWRCQAANSRTRSRNRTTVSDSATVDIGLSDQIEVSMYIERASQTAAGAGSGASLFHDGTTQHMYVVYQSGADQITIGKIDGSGDTELMSWSWLPRSNTVELRIQIDQPEVHIYANGSNVGTYTMTAAEQATFGSNPQFGMESDLDRRTRWSWFRIDSLAP